MSIAFYFLPRKFHPTVIKKELTFPSWVSKSLLNPTSIPMLT